MKAMVIEEPGTFGVREVPTPEPGPYEALVKIDTMALCNATDRKLVEGHFPGVDTYPLALGHENSGTVVKLGDKVHAFKVGDKAIGGLVGDFGDSGVASGWGGFSEYVIVHDHDAMVEDGVADAAHGWFESCEIQRRLADDIPHDEGALLCTWREVYGGIGDFSIEPGQKVLVFGAGPVGLSFVKFMKLLGVKWVGLVDPLANKRELAVKMGADATFTPEAVDVAPGSLDCVVDAVGNENIVNAGLPLVKLGGTIGVYGVITKPTLMIDKAKGPYNFNLIVHQWPTRRRERAAMEPLCEWIRAGRLSAAEFVTHRYNIAELDKALAAVKAGEALKILMRW